MTLSQDDNSDVLTLNDSCRASAELGRRALFANRGFSDRLIEALLAHGLDAPERLLFMSGPALKCIPGVGLKGWSDLDAYRRRFLDH
jgi:hypothetical protein